MGTIPRLVLRGTGGSDLKLAPSTAKKPFATLSTLPPAVPAHFADQFRAFLAQNPIPKKAEGVPAWYRLLAVKRANLANSADGVNVVQREALDLHLQRQEAAWKMGADLMTGDLKDSDVVARVISDFQWDGDGRLVRYAELEDAVQFWMQAGVDAVRNRIRALKGLVGQLAEDVRPYVSAIDMEVAALNRVNTTLIAPDLAAKLASRVPAEGPRFTRAERRLESRLEQRKDFLNVPAEQAGFGFYTVPEGVAVRTAAPPRPSTEDPRLDIDAPFRGQAKAVVRVYDRRFQTALYFRREGEVLPTDQVVFVMLPGASCVHSCGTALIGPMNLFARHPETRQRWAAVVALDLPFHNMGPRDPRMEEIEYYMGWVHSIVATYKAYGKPVVVFGRSSGANTALDLAVRYPGHADGIIAMSGWLAPDWSRTGMEFVNAQVAAGNMLLDPDGLRWVESFENEANLWAWGKKEYYVPSQTPGLVMQGLDDHEEPLEEAKVFWPDYTQKRGFDLAMIEGGQHNLFKLPQPPTEGDPQFGAKMAEHWHFRRVSEAAYAEVMQFTQKVIAGWQERQPAGVAPAATNKSAAR